MDEMSPALRSAFERARNYKMTPEEVFEQKVSFVYGQQMDRPDPRSKDEIRRMLIEHQGYPARTITKEQVEEAIDAMTPGLIAGPIGTQDSYAWIKYAALAAAKAFGLVVED